MTLTSGAGGLQPRVKCGRSQGHWADEMREKAVPGDFNGGIAGLAFGFNRNGG